MRKFTVFQVSSELNFGSVGRIAEQIGEQVIAQGWKSYIAYGREARESKSISYRIGNKKDILFHGIYTRLTDRHGFASRKSTEKLIKFIRELNPDIIHLHHLHGYFINIEILFNFLAAVKIPIVWTFHDCWSFTGHCAYYEFIDCNKWLKHCGSCPQKREYPKSSLIDNSFANFADKKRLFNSVDNLVIVPVSNWLGDETKKSFLKNKIINVIQNGIDLENFCIKKDFQKIRANYNIRDKFLILGVASPWNDRKGLKYFIELANRLEPNYQIMLIGLSKGQIKVLPKNIIGLERTESTSELAELYSAADVFVNPTLEDTFPTTNLESLACGTPVITFRSGGSPEAIDDKTGIVVEKDDLEGLEKSIYLIHERTKEYYQKQCRKRAELYFNKNQCFSNYIELYKQILNLD